MPPNQGAGGGGQSDNSLGPLWVMVGLCIFLAVIWYLFHGYIVFAFFKLKLLEISLISLFSQSLDSTKQLINAISPESVTFKQVNYIASEVGGYIRIPAAILLLIIGGLIFKSGSAGTFRAKYDMNRLAHTEQANWAQIRPMVDLNLVDEDIEKGPWAMAMTPMDFAKKKNLIREQMEEALVGELRKKRHIVAKLKKGEANAIFTMQLGALWQGWQKLPKHAQAIFAVLAAIANDDRKAGDDLMWHMATKFDSKTNKTDYGNADELCKKYGNSKVVQLVAGKHAYQLTFMASLLELAREGGVFATSDFLWLKTVDRKLWFMLNAVGRVTPVVEVAGPFAHWLIEKELDRKIMVPMVEEATKGLEQALTEIIYKRDESVET